MKKKILTTASMLMVAIALIVGSIAGTLAYLRSQAFVTNTFTYGKVGITMDETLIAEDGKTATGNRTKIGNEYLLMPSSSYVKDPVITVNGDSQELYLFLKLDNGIAGLAMTEDEKKAYNKEIDLNTNIPDDEKEAAKKYTIHEQLLANGWKVYEDKDHVFSKTTTTTSDSGVPITTTSTIYYLSVGNAESAVAPRIVEAEEKIDTFKKFHTGKQNVTEASMTAYYNNGCSVIVTAYAVQKDGIANLDAAAAVFATEFASTKTTKTTTPPQD